MIPQTTIDRLQFPEICGNQYDPFPGVKAIRNPTNIPEPAFAAYLPQCVEVSEEEYDAVTIGDSTTVVLKGQSFIVTSAAGQIDPARFGAARASVTRFFLTFAFTNTLA